MSPLDREQRLKLLEEVSLAPGIPGYEGEVAEVLARWAKPVVANPQYDGLGSVIFELAGDDSGPLIMIAAHMDEIGFMVRRVTDDGFIKFQPVGVWCDHALPGHRVRIHSGDTEILGVIGTKPPHLIPSEKRDESLKLKDLYIDIGARDAEEVESFGVRPGDPITPVSTFSAVGDGHMLMSKAWDNRMGCCLLVDLLYRLAEKDHPNTVAAVGTVQEELGLRGAETSTASVKPDVGIALEIDVAGDVPGVCVDEAAAELDSGPSLPIYDVSMIPNLQFRDLVMEVSEEMDIPLQKTVAPMGTDAGKIHLHDAGVPSVVLGVPTRYIHAHSGILSIDDYERTLDLLDALISRLDWETVQSFRRG